MKVVYVIILFSYHTHTYVGDPINRSVLDRGMIRRIEGRFGPMPNDPMGFSLWMTAIAPMDDIHKATLLALKVMSITHDTCVTMYGAHCPSTYRLQFSAVQCSAVQ